MAQTLDSLLETYNKSWQAGKDCRLFLECHAGQAWMHLHLHLSHPPPPSQHHPRPRTPGPSRLRRRARRAEAREAAANAATDEPPKGKETAEVAVQAEEPAQATRDAAVQVDLPVVLAAPHSAAVKAALQPQAAHQPKAAQAARRELPVVQAAQVRPWLAHHHQPLRDAFCPDLHYKVAGIPPGHVSSDIPQTDGNAEEHTWSCKCCQYETFFDTEKQLKQHHDREHDEWEECNWCYPYHVWIDRV